ncbi:MAG: metal ABC transporter permease [Candidatus Micrarchaeota archaeon]
MAADIFSYAFMQRALIGGALVAVVCASLGVFLVLKRLSLLGDGLAHVALAGVAAGLLARVDAVLSALVLTCLGALGVHEIINRTKVHGETATAIVLTVGLGLAVLLIGLAKGFNADLLSYLFGSILTLGGQDLIIMGAVLALSLAFLAAFYKKLVFAAFNSEMARTSGIDVSLMDKLLAIITAMAVVVGMRAVGILLVSALIVMPASAAFQIAGSFRRTLLIAAAIALFCVETGIIAAFYLDLPPSGAIVMLLFLAFLSAAILRKVIVKKGSN